MKYTEIERDKLRSQAAISILGSLIETTKHPLIECIAVKEIYSDIAVLYADALINSLEKPGGVHADEILRDLKKKL